MPVLIGIQARSGSTRLPNKAFALIGEYSVLDRVIHACDLAAKQIQRRHHVEVVVALLTPKQDKIASEFARRCRIVEGDNDDVLGRYVQAAKQFEASHIVRITGDCPLIAPYIIDNLTGVALRQSYDYFSNVDERCRTTLDGHDCEVMSARILFHASDHAKDPKDREHVTTFIRREVPAWAKCGMAVSSIDFSDLKLSVDNEEDLERVRKAFSSAHEKYKRATMIFGKEHVFRL